MLAESVGTDVETYVSEINKNSEIHAPKVIIFKEELKVILKYITSMLQDAKNDIGKYEQSYIWINLVKKINAVFMNKAISILLESQSLEPIEEETLDYKKKLTQKIVIATSLIELKFENILCSKYGICSKTFECTKSLNTLLVQLKNVTDHRAQEFFKCFYDELPNTNFYNTLSIKTARDFETILFNISSTDSILTNSINSAIHKSVEKRQKVIASLQKFDDEGLGCDVALVHIILSDMDFLYSKQKSEPFRDFLNVFFIWTREGGTLGMPLRRVMKDMQSKLSFAADDLVNKLIHEVKVFMEITVDGSK